MTPKLNTVAAAMIAIVALSAGAQNTTRQDVKKEAAAAAKAGAPDESRPAAPTRSTTSRAEVKAAAAKGAVPCGEADAAQSKAAATGKSTVARADVKAETARANKAGELMCDDSRPEAKKK